MNMSVIETITSLPKEALLVLAFLVVSIVFMVLRKLIKFAIMLAALVILVLVIMKLLAH
ncbi:MAG: hypothetical protein ACK45R_01815 [Candidatus Kapaibacterium sp.]